MSSGSWLLYAQPHNSEDSYIQFDADIHSRIRFDSDGRRAFQLGPSSPIDSAKLGFSANASTEDAQIELKLGFDFENQDTNTLGQLNFDEAYIRINNLYDFMDVKFFDIGYGAGKGNSIRPDLPVRGLQFYFRPMSELTLSLGYGIAGSELELHPSSNNVVQAYLDSQETVYTPNYHALKFDILYDNIYVPLGFYYGIVFVDNTTSYLNKNYFSGNIQDRLLHSSLGLTFDFLAFYKEKAFAFDIGFGLPLGTMSRYVKINDDGTLSSEPEFNFLLQLYGDTEVAYGVGIRYQILFALDTHTKQKTLGNLYDEYFKEVFKIALAPRYTYGPFNWDLELQFGIVGGMTARSSYDRKDSLIFNRSKLYNNMTLEAGMNWTPFPFKGLGRDITIRGYYKVDFGDLDHSGDHFNEIGMNLRLSLNTLAID